MIICTGTTRPQGYVSSARSIKSCLKCMYQNIVESSYQRAAFFENSLEKYLSLNKSHFLQNTCRFTSIVGINGGCNSS